MIKKPILCATLAVLSACGGGTQSTPLLSSRFSNTEWETATVGRRKMHTVIFWIARS